MNGITPQRRWFVAEPEAGGDRVVTMDDKGVVRYFDNPTAVVRWVRRRDRRARADVTVTEIRWQHFPNGFEPPNA